MARARGEGGKFVKADDGAEGEEPEAVGGGEESTATTIEDLVGGQFGADEETAGGDGGDDGAIPGQITLDGGEVPATADGGEQAAPAVDDAGAAEDDEPQIVQLEGGGFQLGKFKADTLEGLIVELEKNRRNAESLVGKKKEELASEATNPWLEPVHQDGDDPDGFDEIDGADFATQVGTSIAQQLQQTGLFGSAGGVDPQQAAFAATSAALHVVQSIADFHHAAGQIDEFATPQDKQAFERDAQAALGVLLQHAPQAVQHREALLAAWGRVNPYEAASTRMAIQQAEASFTHQQAQQQALQQAEAAFNAEREEAQAYTDAEGSFLQAHPAAQTPHVRAAVDAMFTQPTFAAIAARAKGDRAAMHAAFELALQTVQATNPALFQQAPPAAQVTGVPQLPPGVTLPGHAIPGQVQAGMSPHVSEQGGIMQGVNVPGIDPNAVYRAQQAQNRDLAALETGAAVGDIAVTLTNPNSPELAQQPTFKDLLGVGLIGE